MRTLLFTDCVDCVGSACASFSGTKKYVSTGAVDIDHINEDDTEIVDYKGKPSRANLEVSPGDILFAKMQGTKKTLLIDQVLANHIYSTGFSAVRAKEGVLTTRCLYHLLTSETFLAQKDKNCSGATQKAITNAGLGKIVIQVPSIEEQDTVASQLDAIADIISKRQQQLSALDDLIKARFVEMFGDPEFNTKSWSVQALDNLCEVLRLDECQLLNSSGTLSLNLFLEGKRQEFWHNYHQIMFLDLKDENVFKYSIGIHTLTTAAVELYHTLVHPANEAFFSDFLDTVIEENRGKNIKLHIHDITGIDGDRINFSRSIVKESEAKQCR